MHDRQKSWLIPVAALCIVLAGVWLAGSSPAEAQTSGSDHGNFTNLTGPFETPQEVTAACLECHVYAADEVMETIHWTWEYTDPITGQATFPRLDAYGLSARGQLGKGDLFGHAYDRGFRL